MEWTCSHTFDAVMSYRKLLNYWFKLFAFLWSRYKSQSILLFLWHRIRTSLHQSERMRHHCCSRYIRWRKCEMYQQFEWNIWPQKSVWRYKKWDWIKWLSQMYSGTNSKRFIKYFSFERIILWLKHRDIITIYRLYYIP